VKEVTNDRVPSKETQRVPLTELPSALSNQGSVCVVYDPLQPGLTIRNIDIEHSHLVIEGVADKDKKIEAQEQMQQLIKVFSENVDFGLTLQDVLLTTALVECLRKISQPKLQWLRFKRCRFQNHEAKRELFTFLVTLPDNITELTDTDWENEYYEFQKNYKAEQARYKKALEDVKAMIVRLEADPDDLQYEEFSAVNCKAIFALAEKNPALCNKPAFKKLFAIASIVNNKKIEISDDEVLQGVKWFMKNSIPPAKVVVRNLQNEQYFDALIQEMKSSGSRECVEFEDLKVSATAVAEYIQLGPAMVTFNPPENFLRVWPLESVTDFTILSFRREVELNTLRQWVEASKFSVRLSINQKLSLSDVECLANLPKIESLDFDGHDGEFAPEAKAYLFEKGRDLISRFTPECAIHREYVQYIDACQQRDRIKSFIAKYRNNTLEYTELMSSEVQQFILLFDQRKQKELTADEREDLIDLVQIITFADADSRENGFVVSDPRRFRLAQWMIVHANRELPNIYVKNVDEACALIAAFELTAQEDVSAVIRLVVNDTYSVNIHSTAKGIVAWSMTGVPQNAEVFNKIVNSVASTVSLELGCDQFLPDMDFSNPGINSITLADQSRKEYRGFSDPDKVWPRFIISAEHVKALTKTKQLISFEATDCDFDSPQTKEAFVDAVLANETLQVLLLSGCGLTKKHLDKITAYAKKHPDLIMVLLGANAYREGEDKELMAVVAENKAHADKMKAREDAINTFIKNTKNLGRTFENAHSALIQNVRFVLKDFYDVPACKAAYIEALQKCVRRMSFSGLDLFREQLKSVDQLLSYCQNLSKEERQSVLDSMVAEVVAHGTDAVLVELLESDYRNDVLLESQRKRFEHHEKTFSNVIQAKVFSVALDVVKKMLFLAFSDSPEILFQKLYKAFLQLADLYLEPNSVGAHSGLILGYLKSIPVAEAELYQQAEEKIKQVFCKLIREILLFDSKTETPSKFQEKSLSELSDLANNPKVVLQDVLNWMKIFIDDSSRILFREKYITNRGDKVDKLEQLGRVMKPYIRTAIPCAPTKTVEDEKLIAAAVLEKEREQQQKPAPIYPPLSVVVPDPVGVPAPQQYYVPPVAYPPAAPIPRQATYAELMAGQRGAESNPVLQGVVPAEAPAPSAPEQEEVAAPVKRVALKTMLTD